MACRKFWNTVQRKRVFSPEQLDTGNLKRCLNRWDLTSLGVGSTLGIGVYVLVGYVALNLAGPSIVLSFLIAAVAASLAGLCYAEFGSRIPRAGSSYIYTYVGVGELAAFLVGWNNIMEGLFGTASIARGLSLFVDSMANSSMSEWFASFAPMNAAPFSQYFDFFSFFLVLILGALLAFGVRESATVNNALTAANIIIIVFIIIAGSVHANIDNWYILEADVPANYGSGGFFPYGVLGTLKGAAVCFYGFVGFDVIASTAEEARDSRKSIPMTILVVLGILFCIYATVAIVFTMMVPYYHQDSMATVFSYVGWEWARWVVSVGAICAISASLIGAMLPLPRLLYAMSSDGLSVHWFSRITKNRKSPAIATIVPTVIIAVLAAVLDINQLLMMMCIGTLFSYTFVAISVIALRYSPDGVSKGSCHRIFPASVIPSRIIYVSLVLFILVSIVIGLVRAYAENVLITLTVLHVFGLLIIIVMTVQPKIIEDVYFKTPLVPLIPCLSIYVNIQLMILVNAQTWIRVAVWIAIGLLIYITCLYFYKRNKNNFLQDNMSKFADVDKNGKVLSSVQIIVEEATPPSTERNDHEAIIESVHIYDRSENTIHTIHEIKDDNEIKREEILIEKAVIENNYEKEAKIIDLLDQVLQAEEDSYEEIISMKDDNNIHTTVTEEIVPRKSLGELSDAGSDASLGNQVLSKYDVIAQVHREDLPIVSEEEEKNDKDERDPEGKIIDPEEQNEINKSETNSRTDESGYSDSFDKARLNDSAEDVKEDAPYIPTPPPLDESFFAQPFFKKSYSMPKPKIKPVDVEPEEENKPRESVKSTSTQGDDHMVFGSEKQMNFMSKLSNIFQHKLNTDNEKELDRKRSNSIGNVTDSKDYMTQNRPLIFEDLKKEIISTQGKHLKPVNVVNTPEEIETNTQSEDETEDLSMSRQDLKSKLESIFANGGTKLVKPRLMKSNPPTPEEAYQTESSSTESIHKSTKKEKNDTLKRQKAKFSEVLNSIRLSYNNDDKV